MEVNKNEAIGVVDVWLTHEDQRDPATPEKIREISRQYSAEKMIVAVFYSGQQDLAEETGALLRYNRRRSAERGRSAGEEAETAGLPVNIWMRKP